MLERGAGAKLCRKERSNYTEVAGGDSFAFRAEHRLEGTQPGTDTPRPE